MATLSCECCERKLSENGPEKPLYLEEWLEVDPVCDVCQKTICEDCVQICYDCHNQGEDITVTCILCSESYWPKLKEIECSYHTWWTCARHDDEQGRFRCGQCRANYNYRRYDY